MSTLELEHLKHASSSSNNLSTHSDGSLTVGNLQSLNVLGDLTVDTSTLKVDATNNRVGIGTTSPTAQLELSAGAPTLILNANSQATDKKKVRLGASQFTAGDFAVQQMADDGTTVVSTPFKIDTYGHTIPTSIKPDKYGSLIGPVDITGGFVNGCAVNTFHSITNVDINNYAGGYNSGNVGIQGEIMWTSGLVAQGYNHTVRFMLPPSSSNTAQSYSSSNFTSFSYSGNVYNEIPVTVTHHTSMSSNHNIRLRLHNTSNVSYDPLRLEIYTSAGVSGNARLTLWRA